MCRGPDELPVVSGELLMLDTLPQTIPDSVALLPLPPLPQLLVQLLTLVENEHAPLPEVAALVAQDPALTAHFFSVASATPYYQETTSFSLEQSIASLGLPLVRTMAACLAVKNLYVQAMYERNLDYSGFWCHSLRVAALAKSLAVASGYQDCEEAYCAGLLHDIGQVLLVGWVGEWCDSFSSSAANEAGLPDVTRTLSAIKHAELGARLIDGWQRPSFMADAVLFHQYPAGQIRSADLLSRIVWAAHYLGGSGADLEASSDLLPDIPVITEMLGIELGVLVTACESSWLWVAERAASFGVQIRVTETAPPHTFIYPYVSLPKRDSRDAVPLQLDALIRTRSVMQSLQQNLLFLSGEAALYAVLREAARLLFGLQRPVFLVPHADRPVLTAADCAGQSPLLQRLEIPLEHEQNLPARAVQTHQPTSSFAAEGGSSPSLSDVQLARLLGSQGILCIPLGDAQQQGGVMVFGLSREQYAGKLRLLEWLSGFARSAAAVIASFRSLQQRDLRIREDLTRQFEQKARKVIHEAVNPLGIINNYLHILAEKLGDGVDVQQELSILKEEIFRVERIVRRLNDLPEQSLPVETVNVNSLIEGMLALYGESLFEARGIVIERELTPGLPLVKAERDSLKQVLLNIWKNSSAAMPAGGRFSIGTRAIETDAAVGSVEISLSDTGPGIPPDVKERLFQPLPPDRRPANSGLGLSIVASLVNRLGGQISCASSPGEGTTFRIRFTQAHKEKA